MTSKIRIKMGKIEVEYEGTEEFLKQELPDLLSAVAKLYQTTGEPIDEATADAAKNKIKTGNGSLKATTTTISAKLKVASGPELILAAGARLSLGQGIETFTRKQIADEIKTATGYYKKSYLGNMTPYLQNLIKDGKLIEASSGDYALSSNTREELEQKLGLQGNA